MSNASGSATWSKLQEIKEKNPMLWKIIIAVLVLLALVALFFVTSIFAPDLTNKISGLVLAPFNFIIGLFRGNKSDVLPPSSAKVN
jgi:hypothetical protein